MLTYDRKSMDPTFSFHQTPSLYDEISVGKKWTDKYDIKCTKILVRGGLQFSKNDKIKTPFLLMRGFI